MKKIVSVVLHTPTRALSVTHVRRHIRVNLGNGWKLELDTTVQPFTTNGTFANLYPAVIRSLFGYSTNKKVLLKGCKGPDNLRSDSHIAALKQLRHEGQLYETIQANGIRQATPQYYGEVVLQKRILSLLNCHKQPGHTYLILEHLEGETLLDFSEKTITESYIADNLNALSLTFFDLIRSIYYKMTQSLDSLHKLGLVHRDVKPENAFLCRDGSVKLLDFGFSHLQSESQPYKIEGTPLYFSRHMCLHIGSRDKFSHFFTADQIEQAKLILSSMKPYNPLGDDTHALGICLYEAFASRRHPFDQQFAHLRPSDKPIEMAIATITRDLLGTRPRFTTFFDDKDLGIPGMSRDHCETLDELHDAIFGERYQTCQAILAHRFFSGTIMSDSTLSNILDPNLLHHRPMETFL